jgi:DNA-directed RNA polymerase specialized sigma24 family protein
MEKNTSEGVPAPEKIVPLTNQLKASTESLYEIIQRLSEGIDPENGKDLAHDTLLNIIIPRLQEGHELKGWLPHQQRGWLKTTLKREHWRSNALARRLSPLSASVEADEQYQPYDVQNNVQIQALKERQKRVLRKLAEEVLTDDQFNVFDGRLRECFYEKIAEDTGLKAATCRQMMRRQILPRLLQAFKDRGLA